MKNAKKLLLAAFAVALMVGATACSGGGETTPTNSNAEQQEEQKETVLNLEGEWKQSNSDSETSWHEATITGDTIEIYWVSTDNDTRALYWAGSYIKPTSNDKKYTWDSVNDTEKTGSALLASSDDTKTFTYEDDCISYSASAMGVEKTIKLERKQ